MSTDDDTKRGKHRHQTQTERDLASIRAHRDRTRAEGEIVVRGAAPPSFIDDVDTGRVELFEDDPKSQILYARSEHNRRLIAIAREESANRDLEIAGERPPDARFEVLERRLRFSWWILTAIAIPALSSMIIVGKYLYTKGETDTRATFEREQLKAQMIDHEARLRELELSRPRIQTPGRVNP